MRQIAVLTPGYRRRCNRAVHRFRFSSPTQPVLLWARRLRLALAVLRPVVPDGLFVSRPRDQLLGALPPTPYPRDRGVFERSGAWRNLLPMRQQVPQSEFLLRRQDRDHDLPPVALFHLIDLDLKIVPWHFAAPFHCYPTALAGGKSPAQPPSNRIQFCRPASDQPVSYYRRSARRPRFKTPRCN